MNLRSSCPCLTLLVPTTSRPFSRHLLPSLIATEHNFRSFSGSGPLLSSLVAHCLSSKVCLYCLQSLWILLFSPAPSCSILLPPAPSCSILAPSPHPSSIHGSLPCPSGGWPLLPLLLWEVCSVAFEENQTLNPLNPTGPSTLTWPVACWLMEGRGR